MRRTLRTAIVLTAALTAAVTLYISATLPIRTVILDGQPPAGHVSGGYHIHTSRSDGTGSVDDVARAAAEAGLHFVILTDHGDGTRAPEAPAYRHGVLVIDAVELNSREGHLVALDMAAPAPYPLAGPAREVIEDVHRLGGVAVIAHPDSPAAGLGWRGQNIPFDGIEWLSVDSEWRDETPGRLIQGAAQSLIRPAEAIAGFFSRPARTLRRWDTALRSRAVFGIAAVDAHARIGWDQDEEPRQRTLLRRPSYGTLLRTVSQTAVLDGPLTGDARTDAARVVGAIINGRSYSVVRALATPASLTFAATRGSSTFSMGDRLLATAEPTEIHASVPEAPGARLTLLRDGTPAATGLGSVTYAASPEPASYRVEATFPGADVPWIVSNAITIEREAPQGRAVEPASSPAETVTLPLPNQSQAWTTERDPASTAAFRVDDGQVRFDYQLGPGVPRGQYAALVVGDHGEGGVERIHFVGRADRPMRLSVQVRLPGTQEGRRWRQSVYLDETARSVSLRLQDFEPADRPTTRRPIVAPIQSLLFVVDTVNNRPGDHGVVWLSGIAIGVNPLAN